MPEKPIDRWLSMGSIAVGLALALLPKTPALVIIGVSAIFLLLLHPVLYFWWIEKTKRRRAAAIVFLAVLCLVLGYAAWPFPTLKPIELTAERRAQFINALKTGMVIPQFTIISCPQSNEEACIYAGKFIPLFQRAGWKVEGPYVERADITIPDGTVSIVDFGPPLVHPQNPDEGVWTKVTPWHQTIHTAFQLIGIITSDRSDPLLLVNKVRIYFGAVPKSY